MITLLARRIIEGDASSQQVDLPDIAAALDADVVSKLLAEVQRVATDAATIEVTSALQSCIGDSVRWESTVLIEFLETNSWDAFDSWLMLIASRPADFEWLRAPLLARLQSGVLDSMRVADMLAALP